MDIKYNLYIPRYTMAILPSQILTLLPWDRRGEVIAKLKELTVADIQQLDEDQISQLEPHHCVMLLLNLLPSQIQKLSESQLQVLSNAQIAMIYSHLTHTQRKWLDPYGVRELLEMEIAQGMYCTRCSNVVPAT